MPLALVDKRKVIQPEKSLPVTPHRMYFLSTPLPSVLSLLLSGSVSGKLVNPGSCGRMAIKLAYVCVCNVER